MKNSDIILDLKDRYIGTVDSRQYKSNKKEEFLFKFFTEGSNKNYSRFNFGLINTDDDKENITQDEVQALLENKKLQKNNITEEDLINFLNKVKMLNPTKQEKYISEMSEKYKDEAENSIMNVEMAEIFGFKSKTVQIKDFIDEDNNIKSEYKAILDLNGDGKLDIVEKEFIEKNLFNKSYDKQEYFVSNSSNLKAYLDFLDGEIKDGKITNEDKQKFYDKAKAEHEQQNRNKLDNVFIKTNGKLVITPEIKKLFNGQDEIAIKDILDENGNIKPGFEIFDLNGDGKFDELEQVYFASGGHGIGENKGTISIDNLISTLNDLDAAGIEKKEFDYQNVVDFSITPNDKKSIYKILQGMQNMLDNMPELPEDLKQAYNDALKEVRLKIEGSKGVGGTYLYGMLGISDPMSLSIDEISSRFIHELTHCVLEKISKMPDTEQEVETFYSEYKLYKQLQANHPERKLENTTMVPVFNKECIAYIDKLKEEHPEMSEKEIAVESFLKYQFELYNGMYTRETTAEQFRESYLHQTEQGTI